MNSKQIGDLTEAMVLQALLKRGFAVSIPWGDCQRYDMIVEINGTLRKVQCKTARVRNGVLLFNCYSTSSKDGKKTHCRYSGQIDFFGVYCRENDKVYLIPEAACGLQGRFRLKLGPGASVLRPASEFEL